jgi:hypothetical protein
LADIDDQSTASDNDDNEETEPPKACSLSELDFDIQQIKNFALVNGRQRLLNAGQLKFHPPFFLFLAWWPSWLEVGITGHNFERGPSKDHSTKVWFKLAKCPPFKMAAVTKNRNFFNCPLLL